MPTRHTFEWSDPNTGQMLRRFDFKANLMAEPIGVVWNPPLPLIVAASIARTMLSRGYARTLFQKELDHYNSVVDAYHAQLQAIADADNVDAAQVKALGEPKPAAEPELKTDGPTVAEYVAAGYRAANYPPEGYASKSTEAEIKAAIEKQAADDKAKEDEKPAPGSRAAKIAAALAEQQKATEQK